MFAIEILSNNRADLTLLIQAVAAIEALVQPQDAWTYQTLIELLEQDSINVLIIHNLEKSSAALDKVVGYCLYQVMFEQAEILRIGTHPTYQRIGLASRLFDYLNLELQNKSVESLLLEVRADNVPAIGLYEQQQFTVIHRRKGYYQLPHQPAVDALIMQRTYN